MDISKQLLSRIYLRLAKNKDLVCFAENWMKTYLDLTFYLGYNDLYQQGLALLTKVSMHDPLGSGVLFTNIPKENTLELLEREARLKNEWSKEPDIDFLLAEYPPNTLKRIEQDERCVHMFRGFQSAIDGDYETAVDLCRNEQRLMDEEQIEFIIAYLFMKQKFLLGTELMKQHVTKHFSIDHLERVELIERAKVQEWETVAHLFRRIYPDWDDIWFNFIYAKGFAGLLPYDPYPMTEHWD